MITTSAAPAPPIRKPSQARPESGTPLAQERGLRCHNCGTVVIPLARQIEDLLKEVAKDHMVDAKALAGKSRFPALVRARDCFAYRAYLELRLSIDVIGEMLGRHPSGIYKAIDRATDGFCRA